MSPLPNLNRDAMNAYSGFYLEPVGTDPADCFAYLGIETPRQRMYYEQKGFLLIAEVTGDLTESTNPLRVAPPSLDKCGEVLAELQARVPAQRERLLDLLEIHAEAADDREMRRDERMQSRQAVRNIRQKILQTYEILPAGAEELKAMEAEAEQLESQARDTDALPDDRRDARDQARELRDRVTRLKRITPITGEKLRAFFLRHQRMMVGLAVPPWVRAGQAMMAEEQALAQEEAELVQ